MSVRRKVNHVSSVQFRRSVLFLIMCFSLKSGLSCAARSFFQSIKLIFR